MVVMLLVVISSVKRYVNVHLDKREISRFDNIHTVVHTIYHGSMSYKGQTM